MQSLLSITERLWTAVRRLAPVGRGKLPGFQPVAGGSAPYHRRRLAAHCQDGLPLPIACRHLAAGAPSVMKDGPNIIAGARSCSEYCYALIVHPRGNGV